MRYRDRQGNEYEQTSSQDRFLASAYSSAAGRALMKFLSLPVFSKCARAVLSSRLSAGFVPSFADKHGIDMFDYEQKNYESFNEFFCRRIKEGRRYFEKNDRTVVSPSDGKVSAYEITPSNFFVVKNSVYSIESLLRDKKLAKRYQGGTALIIRLSPDDYHRYIYPVKGVKSRDRYIKGFLHTVNPVVNRYVSVYKENSRAYCVIRTKELGDIVQMEVGALNVGRITNHNPHGGYRVDQGVEKGYFEFGGSTIILLLEKDKTQVCEDLFKNTAQGYETRVRQGELLAAAK
ncbi:MAG: phosphatidylserine decarboxylase [Ruminococcus sp.]|nr:phosphatidylserine decarboxylase [Ruminococcus sp.]